jgi:hypothetical protein
LLEDVGDAIKRFDILQWFPDFSFDEERKPNSSQALTRNALIAAIFQK